MRRSVALLAAAGCTHGLQEEYVRDNGALLFRSFKDTHHKAYPPAEESRRFEVFVQNMIEAARLEREDGRATFGMSKFADLTATEFKVYHSLNVSATASPAPTFSAAEVKQALASSVDWRSKGAVTQVKNQAQCGSCWSFSSTGGIEGQWFLAGNKLTSVSEQQLVSCDKIDNGCGGGLMGNAYDWLVKTTKGKIVTEEAYPYTSGAGKVAACQSTAGMPVGAVITSHTMIAHSEDQMAAYVAKNGPLPIAVDASNGWQTYTGGVMSTCKGTSLDHGVLVVGVTPDYWIVKNSWGPTWGENGFIRLQYGTNQCGLNQSPTAVVASQSAALGAAPRCAGVPLSSRTSCGTPGEVDQPSCAKQSCCWDAYNNWCFH